MDSEIRVLHVDDEVSITELTSDMLERKNENIIVETTQKPEDAIEIFKSGNYDAIISDYSMPKMNGVEVLREVRDIDQEIPFVLFTGKGTEEIASEAISANVTDYIQKTGGTEQYDDLYKILESEVRKYNSIQQLNYHTSLLESVYQTTLDAVVVTDLNGEILECNDKTADILDTGDAISGRNIRDIFESYVVSSDSALEEINNRFNDPKSEYRQEFVMRNGNIVDVFSQPINTDGLETGFVWFCRDITDVRQLEQSHREAFDRIDNPVFSMDKDWNVRFTNDEAEEIFGIDEGTIIEENLDTAFSPEQYEKMYEQLKYSMEDKEDHTFEMQIDSLNSSFDVRLYPSDRGMTVYLEKNTNQDEEQLSRLVRELRDLYRITSDGEKLFDDRLKDLLKHGAKHFGFETAFVGKIDSDKLRVVESYSENEKLQKGSRCPMNDTYCQETIDVESNLLVIKDAADYWDTDKHGETPYEVFGLETYIGAKIKIDGEIYGTLCFATEDGIGPEITESDKAIVEVMARWLTYELEQNKKKEDLEDANQNLSRFAEIVTHDLRNPLTVAKGRLEIEMDERESENLQKIDSSLDRIESIIERVLMVSKDFDLDKTDYVNMNEIVEGCWQNVQTEAMDVNKKFDSEIEIKGDSTRIKQIFENIFRNAEEHGGPNVTVGVTENGFYIEDDGDGISGENLSKMFDYGFTTGGTGLGLYIVHQIVDDHGWNIEAKSDNGARFEISNVDIRRSA